MTDSPTSPFDIAPISIEEEMKRSYLDYAMSVIVSRALPDVRDGLKPVHRRILYAMHEGGYDYNKPFRKSARIVGDVIGKYHPHGEAAIYDAMVRMAQDFSMRLPLIDGQGNYGSMDGDPAAAMRYTEARLSKAGHELLQDIDKETVDFQSNYDDSTQEPLVLPARFPNLLVNGAGGIAVGMATNIPTHNLGEVIDGCLAYLDRPEITVAELMELIPGPDFPTGGEIIGRAGIRDAYHSGKGSIVMRAKTSIEKMRNDREAIIVSEVPYQVNKARMIERIADLVRDKTIEGIGDLRDESDRDGVRVVIELRRDAVAEVVLNQLYRFTPLQTSFGVNMLALNGGRPEALNLKDILAAFTAFREEVITRRVRFELKKAQERAHILAGLAIAVANIDEFIRLIRAAPDPASAREALMSRPWPAETVEALIRLIDEPGRTIDATGHYALSEEQARAILDLRLHRLTGLEREKLAEEAKTLCEQIADYHHILENRPRRLNIMRDELRAIRNDFATPRRTEIIESEFEQDIEDLIQREDMVVTVTLGGYIKRVPVSAYRAQRRGGKGRAGMAMREEDVVNHLFIANTHTPVLFFSTTGMVYKLKVYRLPLGTPQARGKALVNLLPLAPGESISTVMPLPEQEEDWADMDIVFATASGNIRRNSLSDFTNVKANGKIAMKLEEEDQLIGVQVCNEGNDILLSAKGGRCIRFPVSGVRRFVGRGSVGVRGMKLESGDRVISLSILRHVDASTEEREAFLKAINARRRREDGVGEISPEDGQQGTETMTPERFAELEVNEEIILSVTANGFGKRSSAYEYRITGRGGQGIANIEMSERNGPVVASFPVADTNHIMLVTDGGQMIRCPVKDIRISGRRTQGVVLFKVGEDEHVVSVSCLKEEDESAEALSETASLEEASADSQDGPDHA